LLFSEAERSARAVSFALPASGAVSFPRPLSTRALPNLLEPPRFRRRTRPLDQDRSLLGRLRLQITRQMLLAAGVAAFVLLLATALPAIAALRGGDDVAAPSATYTSSEGATATAAMRVGDLDATTFVGGVPFVQQLRFLGAVSGDQPAASEFVLAARQAAVAGYVQDVSSQIALPYLSDAAATRSDAIAFAQAVEQQERQQAIAAAIDGPAWQAPPIIGGTRIAGATVTFYACIGNGFCGNMASGQPPFAGAAACSSDLPFGTRFTVVNDPTGRVFVCMDRGALSATWVDIWFYDAADGWAWQSYVGTVSDIIIQ
jgi:hypothetical protein